MAHRIGGRKLSRKQGPRLALFKNLTVSVLRYERVQTTEAKAKEVQGRVERMITLAKRNDLTARRAVVAAFPNEPLVVTKLFDEIAPKYADRSSGYTRIVKIGDAQGRRRPDRPDRARLGGLAQRPHLTLERACRARYRATVEYDGTDFAGFQVQRRGLRTVQGELEAALARLSDGVRQPVDGAGRTDAGVHAAGQVIGFTYAGRLDAEALEAALNGLLPPDVAIRDVRRTQPGFHPRRAARYREYRYTVWNGPRSPLRERQALGVRVPLDVAAMERAGQAFVGRHDFSAFGAVVGDRTPVRTVHAVRVRRQGSLVTIDVRADAFLRGMVRRMVAVLLEVGTGKMDEEEVRAALAARTPARSGAAAPARGLCLRRVVLGRRPGQAMRTETTGER